MIIQLVVPIAILLVITGLLWSGLASGAEYPVLGDPIPPKAVLHPATGQKLAQDKPVPQLSQSSIQAYVLKASRAAGVNPNNALWILKKESGFCGWQREGHYDPAIEGPEPNGTISYGCWQFNSANEGFDKACATDLPCSTSLAMKWILAGKINKWSTMRFCRRDYPDCPF